MKVIAKLARTWLGSLFLYSAVLKLLDYKHAGTTVRRYAVLPNRLSTIVGFALPWAEILSAISLLFGWLYPLGPLLSAGLGSSFAYTARRVLQREEDVSCGCAGSQSGYVSKTTIYRGLTITVCSLLILFMGKRRYTTLPRLSLWSGIGACLLPILMQITRNVRRTQFQRQQAEYRKQRIEQLTRVLAAPAPLNGRVETLVTELKEVAG